MTIASIDRNRDVVYGAADLELLHTFESFPVFMGCTSQPRSDDLVHDMSFWISRGSGMTQLNPLLPLDVLYPEAHGAGCVGTLWAQHHQAFAEFISRFNPASVLEIGGAHGILSTNYQRIRDIPWTILEPNPTPIEECRAKIIKGFFDENFRDVGDVGAVVHSHVFEHIYEPDAFVKQLADFLPEGRRLIFAVPNMEAMLERKYTNCLNFEHTIYISEDHISELLTRHGFVVTEKSYFLDDHSIFFSAVRASHAETKRLPPTLYNDNRRLYLEYVDYHRELIAGLNERLAKHSGNVYLFGAHVFSQYLLAFGLDASRIECLLDNDNKKQGQRLYGTDLFVESPRVLASQAQPAVILKAGVYNDEIKADVLQNINPNTVFFE